MTKAAASCWACWPSSPPAPEEEGRLCAEVFTIKQREAAAAAVCVRLCTDARRPFLYPVLLPGQQA